MHLKVTELKAFLKDPHLSNCVAAHMELSVGQGEGENKERWKQYRNGRITASNLIQIVANPQKYAEMLWKGSPGLSDLKSIKWGRENESVARELYSKLYNCQVQEVWIFISRLQPLVGASPGSVIEVEAISHIIGCPLTTSIVF